MVKMVKILSEHNRYDGMLSGVCLYEGKVCWFSCRHMKDIFIPRTYRVFELSKIDQFRIRLGDWIFEKIIRELIVTSPRGYGKIHRAYDFLYKNLFSVKSEKDLKIVGAFNEDEYYR